MRLRKLKWYLVAYVLFDLLIGGTCAGILPLAQLAAAQFTTVTGTIVDPNGIAYANGTIVAVLILPGGTSPTLSGLPYTPPTQPVGLDGTGSFTMQLADNTVLLPAATKWSFTVCSAAGTVQPSGGKGPVCFTLAAPITISGTSQSISSNLNAVALSLANILGVPKVTTSGQGYFLGNGWLNAIGSTTTTSNSGAGSTNVYATQFVLPVSVTVGHITIEITLAGAASSTQTVGIYSADRNTKLIDSGTFNGASATVQTNAITAVTLTPGIYWLAQSFTSSGAAPTVRLLSNATLQNVVAGVSPRIGQAANGTTGGVLPSSLGTITSTAVNAIAAIFEP